MSKTLKKSFLLLIIALGILFFKGTVVNATTVDVSSINDLKTIFDSTKITVEGNKIIINENTSVDANINIKKGNYIIEFPQSEMELELSGSITTSGGNISIVEADMESMWEDIIKVPKGKSLKINNGTYCQINNYGTLEFNDGYVIKGIQNHGGKITINGGDFVDTEIGGGFWNIEGELTVTGGTIRALQVMDETTTNISGGLLDSIYIHPNANVTIMGAKFIPSDVEFNIGIATKEGSTPYEESIKRIIGVGFEAKYDEYKVEYDTACYYNVKIEDETKNYSDVFKKVTTTGTLTVNAFKPKKLQDTQFLLSAIVSDLINDDNYFVIAYSDESFDTAIVNIMNQKTQKCEERKVKVVYKELNANTTNKVTTLLGKLKQFDPQNMLPEEGYMLDDLYLINYLYTNQQTYEITAGKGVALNFAKDLINATNGGNVHYRFDERLGAGTESELWSYSGGQAIVYFDGVPYTSTNIGLTKNHIIYIPDTTEKTTSAYEKAALKRIEEYLGSANGISVSFGGTLSSLNLSDEDKRVIDVSKTDGNYYNITIKGTTYKFVIMTKNSSKLETPKYIGSDIMSNITISSDVTTIPLDTALTVKNVTSKAIESALGTDIYYAYDISLYSNFKSSSITKLSNGNFVVSIPVPNALKDKEITVYYITSEGEKEEHKATVKDGFATFETNHFSIYTLAEKKVTEETPASGEKDETPKTGVTDITNYIIAVATISAVGIIALKKKEIK